MGLKLFLVSKRKTETIYLIAYSNFKLTEDKLTLDPSRMHYPLNQLYTSIQLITAYVRDCTSDARVLCAKLLLDYRGSVLLASMHHLNLLFPTYELQYYICTNQLNETYLYVHLLPYTSTYTPEPGPDGRLI